MKRHRWLLMLLAAPMLASAARAQETTITVRGAVEDAGTGAALPGANVMLEDLRLGTTSDAKGRFALTGVPGGVHMLSVSYMGYHIFKIKIRATTADLTIGLNPRTLPGQEVVIAADRAVERETPVAFTDMNREQIAQAYWSQDVPMLLSEMPNVYAYSDAGNGIGYSYLKIRGFDQRRVGVMINGIPLNDPEDHQVYWVDHADLPANLEDMQVQRGVTNSLYGASAFGGSVNLVTSTLARDRGLAATVGMGSFDTRKFTFAMNSGLIDNTYSVYGRFSRIATDGYRERSDVEAWSYFLAAARYGERSTLRLNVYGGPELTHAAWDAVHEDELKTNRRANPATADYENTIDNFYQPVYQVIHEWQATPDLMLSNSFFYVKGKGYYEGLKTRRSLRDFGFGPIQTLDPTLFGADSLRYYVTTDRAGIEVLDRDASGLYTLNRTDLVRQKWVDKDHFGWLPRMEIRHRRGTLTLGGEVSEFNSEHWGQVIWAAGLRGSANPELRYYNHRGHKLVTAAYFHETYQVDDRLRIMGDMQFQHKKYEFRPGHAGNFQGVERNAYEVAYTFLNPKFGANYNLSDRLNVFGSFAIAQREPADADYYDTWKGPDDLGVDPLFAYSDTIRVKGQIDRVEWADPMIEPEKVYDYELGIGYRSGALHIKANAYLMDFHNEIIPYGQVDDDGNPIRGNAEKAVHRGLEFYLSAQVDDGLSFQGNLSLSQNYFDRFTSPFWREDYSVANIDYSGNTIPLFPGILANARLTYAIAGASLSAHVQHVGRQYLDNEQRQDRSLDPFRVVNLTISYNLSRLLGAGAPRITARLNNALDVEYETSGYYDPWAGANFLYPAAGRNFFLSFTSTL